MKNQRGAILLKVGSCLLYLILIIVLIICFNMYRRNYFNGFGKAVKEQYEKTKFSRDSEEKYSEYSSYKIENIEFNDSAFYREIEVEPNTPYKISCMVKTENVVCQIENEDGGVSIGLLETTEYSAPITGTNDWQKLEFMFDSKNREKVKISFRIGGNDNNCTGTAWFSEFKLEKGIKNQDSEWNIGCFIIKELDVNIEGKQYKIKTNLDDLENVRLNMQRYKNDCYELSDHKMTVNYEIIEITEPVTTISYEEEHGYYIAYKDVKDLIYETVKQKEYDHIFVVCRMEDEEGKVKIPIKDNWLGLGSMDIYETGYSLIRVNKKSNDYTYKYGITHQTPEEVYLHEFLHTLERNLKERGYVIPGLHDYKQYGYTEMKVDGLIDWYRDYMRKEIIDSATGEKVGLDEACYTTQPPNNDNFKYAIEIEFNKEPQNLFEEILTIFNAFK